ncbi:hypothetical protein BCR34DRAFT_596108 [Clohesyomyces aquaticus]|uniref:Uncharacterized protein n=1 Tax=Clohesyomyces aquaticus TaxID=1231657 RepID=A0A1Y2A7J2_9PLEO|nr:hypothetical protein BCR34DRAFT_596108 [Clohesyomyces aquaticus]
MDTLSPDILDIILSYAVMPDPNQGRYETLRAIRLVCHGFKESEATEDRFAEAEVTRDFYLECALRLTAAHDKCVAWAKRYGAKFAPDKYQLMHFTRRRGQREDLASTVRIAGDEAELCTKSIRILGIWVDPKLQWKEHTQKAAQNGESLFNAMARITAST